MRAWLRHAIGGFVIAVCTGCVLLAGLFFLIRRNACSTEVLQTVNLSDVRFEIESASCDLIAKDEVVNVYAMRATQTGSWPFSNLWRNKRLIFRYDPGRGDTQSPTITHPSQSEIRISVPEVSSIILQSHNWENISISYEIGKVYYPTKPD